VPSPLEVSFLSIAHDEAALKHAECAWKDSIRQV